MKILATMVKKRNFEKTVALYSVRLQVFADQEYKLVGGLSAR